VIGLGQLTNFFKRGRRSPQSYPGSLDLVKPFSPVEATSNHTDISAIDVP
jgi:hypothetical protein